MGKTSFIPGIVQTSGQVADDYLIASDLLM